jgi:hypothetical protein
VLIRDELELETEDEEETELELATELELRADELLGVVLELEPLTSSLEELDDKASAELELATEPELPAELLLSVPLLLCPLPEELEAVPLPELELAKGHSSLNKPSPWQAKYGPVRHFCSAG